MKNIKLGNGEEIIIRQAIREDAKKVVEYINIISGETNYHTFGKGEFDKTIEDEEKIIESSLEENNKLFIVVERNNEIIGNLTFMGGQRPRVRHMGNLGMTVLKDYWGLGIGRNLMGYLIDWAKKTETVKKINLQVREDNNRAIKLYKDFGFKEEGIIARFFYINGEYYNAIFMGLNID